MWFWGGGVLKKILMLHNTELAEVRIEIAMLWIGMRDPVTNSLMVSALTYSATVVTATRVRFSSRGPLPILLPSLLPVLFCCLPTILSIQGLKSLYKQWKKEWEISWLHCWLWTTSQLLWRVLWLNYAFALKVEQAITFWRNTID